MATVRAYRPVPRRLPPRPHPRHVRAGAGGGGAVLVLIGVFWLILHSATGPADPPAPQPDPAPAGTYTAAQLEQLWTSAGGSPGSARMAAAVALAESGGRSAAVSPNTNGTLDRGLWQINSIHGAASTTDPTANARAAVAISANGANWRPWCTAWSDHLCGTQGGVYLGPGTPALTRLAQID